MDIKKSGWMTKDEYFNWLEKNANKEEAAAEKVVEEIIRIHSEKHISSAEHYTPYFKPHHVIVVDVPTCERKVRIEFDLLMLLKHNKYEGFNKFIGVEFKEYDSSTVVEQAIVRRLYVDYMYIALKRYSYIKPEDVLLLSYFGIGWIMWDTEPKFAYSIFSATYKRSSSHRHFIISYLAQASMRDWISFEIENIYEKSKNKKSINLFSFGGD